MKRIFIAVSAIILFIFVIFLFFTQKGNIFSFQSGLSPFSIGSQSLLVESDTIHLTSTTLNSATVFSDMRELTVWNSQYSNGEINAYIEVYTIENADRFLGAATHKNDLVFWKGSFTGVVDDNIFKISNYGNFFSLNGVDGYFVIDETLSDDWRDATHKFTYSPDLSGFKDFNQLLLPGPESAGGTGHKVFSFSEMDRFILCWHKPDFSSSDEIWKFVKMKFDDGVKVDKYNIENEKLKLLYEDGTYFEWDQAVKYLCKIN